MLATMVLGSATVLAACSNGYGNDEDLTNAPYSEERTVGADERVVRRPVVRSAEPVFVERQMK